MKQFELTEALTSKINAMQDDQQARIDAFAEKLRDRFFEDVSNLLVGFLIANGITATEIKLNEDFTQIEYND